MNYDATEEFRRDFKKLLKKFPSLVEDLEVNKQYRIELFHCQEINSGSIFEIQAADNTEDRSYGFDPQGLLANDLNQARQFGNHIKRHRQNIFL